MSAKEDTLNAILTLIKKAVNSDSVSDAANLNLIETLSKAYQRISCS